MVIICRAFCLELLEDNLHKHKTEKNAFKPKSNLRPRPQLTPAGKTIRP